MSVSFDDIGIVWYYGVTWPKLETDLNKWLGHRRFVYVLMVVPTGRRRVSEFSIRIYLHFLLA